MRRTRGYPPVWATGGVRRRGWPSAGRAAAGAQSIRGQEVDGSSGPGRPARASANRRHLPPGRAGQGKEEGTQETQPQETWRRGQRPEVAQKGPLVNRGIPKIRDLWNSIAAQHNWL